MSESSQRAGEESLQDSLEATIPGLPGKIGDYALKFEKKTYEFFDVEFTTNGDDIVYHFWPANDQTWFLPDNEPEVFAKALEEGFKEILPEDADVRADYTDPRESLALLRLGENPDMEEKPRETYAVRVIGWATNPMSDRFLKDEVFNKVDEAVRRTQ